MITDFVKEDIHGRPYANSLWEEDYTEIKAKVNDLSIYIKNTERYVVTQFESERAKENKRVVYVLYRLATDGDGIQWNTQEGIFETEEKANEVCAFLNEHATGSQNYGYVEGYYVDEQELF